MKPSAEDVRRALLPVLEAAPVKLAVLFGSVARGRARADSDVDIAVLPDDPEMTLVDEGRLVDALAAACGRDVDLVRLDLADDFVRWQVARDGVVLLSRPASVAPRFVAEAAIAHAELAPQVEAATALWRARVLGRPA